MKPLIFSLILVSFFSNTLVRATETTPIVITKEPSTPGPGPAPLSISFIPVSGTISDIELALYFESSLGEASITLSDDSNRIVYLETVQTSLVDDFHLPVGGWKSGKYNLTITYSNTILRGIFLLE